MPKRLLRLAAATALVAAFVRPEAASADCGGPYPSFTEVAPSADIVVVGQVVRVDVDPQGQGQGWSSRFTLQIEQVLRGTAGFGMEIRDMPSQSCAGWITAQAGSRIALAMDAVAFDPPLKVNTFAIIDGAKPLLEGVEQLTLAEVLTIVPPLPSAAAPTPGSDMLSAVVTFAMIVLVVGGLVAWRTGRES